MASATKPATWHIVLVLLVGICAVSTAAILIRLAFNAAGTETVGFSLVIAALRLTIAALILFPAWRTFHHQVFRPVALYYSGTAGICLAIHFATWITSLTYTSIAASTALVTTNPVWVALLSWVWFKEKPSRMTICGIAIALVGGLWVGLAGTSSTSMGHNPPLGNGLALLGSWAVSLYFLLGREAQKQGLGISSHVVLTYSTATVVLLPLPFLFGTAYTGYPGTAYLYIFLMALFSQVIGHTSFNWAVRWVSPTLVTLTILGEPVGAGVLGLMVFGENPGWGVIVGAIAILSGVAIAALGTRHQP